MLNFLASLVCHQAPERTIQIGGHLLPLCSRCTGIYLGFLVGLLYQFILWQTKIKELPGLKVSFLCVFFLMLLIIDSLGSCLKLLSLPNYARLILGFLGGSSISLFLFPTFNYSLFENSKKDRGIKSWIEYFGLLLFLLLIALLVFIGNSIVYYPVAFVSISGILILYLMINTTIAARITRWKNRRSAQWVSIFLLVATTLILTTLEFYILQRRHLKL